MLHQIAPQYIDTGKARVIYKHFAFLGPESEWAAQASECAAEQGRFWGYTNYLFSQLTAPNRGTFAHSNLKQFAVKAGLAAAAFNQCLDSNKYASFVQQQTNEGRTRGVRSTPTFYINGQKFEGLLSRDELARLIESHLPR